MVNCRFCRTPRDIIGECLGEPICAECEKVYGENYQIRKEES